MFNISNPVGFLDRSRIPFSSVRHVITSYSIHYTKLYEESSIRLIDQFIEWCKQYKLYVILDLHGAPGGQTGTNIDDCENDQPELFIQESYRRQTVQLWRELADRYKDEWIVGGYDLLNEPLPNFFNQYNDMLMPLYQEITAVIREVDQKHLIILEGAHWATDWSVFTEMFDRNILLQFHKYWIV